MAEDQWQSAKGSEITVIWKEKQHGFEVEGYLFDMKHNQGPKNNSSVYTLKKENGEKEAFWGSAVLDDQIQQIPMGTYMKIKYEGLVAPKKNPSGPKYHSFEVFFSANKTIDMSANDANVQDSPGEQPQGSPAQGSTAPAAGAAVGEDDDLPF